MIDKIREFVADNSWYLLGVEARRFLGASFRGVLLAHRLRTSKLRIGRNSYIRGVRFISIGPNFTAGDGLWLHALTKYREQRFTPRIHIGTNVYISNWTHIAATNRIDIGDDVLLGSKVMITDHNHGQYSGPHVSPDIPPVDRPLDSDKGVVIGKNVWLGDGVVVTPGSVIGEGSVVGANSVVRGAISPFTIVAGSPARIIKSFDFDQLKWVSAK